ncbi:MAG: TrmH family RNA methyltransferase [Solirubrobacteraceae bacterium]|nr:TrmH family RNA methyltransferase [Solirubrobacteraceae bacterium]
MSNGLIERVQRARRDPSLVVVEGFHALKHAVRFGATFDVVATSDLDGLATLAGSLAPDVAEWLSSATVVAADALAAMAPRAPRTAVMAVARRPVMDPAAVWIDPRERPVVLLEDPRTMGNVGACVRVAAGAGAAAVVTTGPSDPWHPDAVRGGAGLQFALPVGRLEAIPARTGRPLLALDPEGEELDPRSLPARAIFAFGTERDGLSPELLDAADARIRLPMEAGVSSLNLATSVAAVLYAWRLARG